MLCKCVNLRDLLVRVVVLTHMHAPDSWMDTANPWMMRTTVQGSEGFVVSRDHCITLWHAHGVDASKIRQA